MFFFSAAVLLTVYFGSAVALENQCVSEDTATTSQLLEKVLERLGGLEVGFRGLEIGLRGLEVGLEVGLRTLREEIKVDLQEIKVDIRRGFQDLHDFGSSRVKVAQKATMAIDFAYYNCSGIGTRHIIYNDGYYAQVFTPHFSCDTPPSIPEMILCEQADIGLLAFCPESEFSAINITEEVNAVLGDEVITYGYGNIAKMWKGYISNILTEDHCVSHRHWKGKSCNQRGRYAR